jgi:hypothetical protein
MRLSAEETWEHRGPSLKGLPCIEIANVIPAERMKVEDWLSLTQEKWQVSSADLFRSLGNYGELKPQKVTCQWKDKTDTTFWVNKNSWVFDHQQVVRNARTGQDLWPSKSQVWFVSVSAFQSGYMSQTMSNSLLQMQNPYGVQNPRGIVKKFSSSTDTHWLVALMMFLLHSKLGRVSPQWVSYVARNLSGQLCQKNVGSSPLIFLYIYYNTHLCQLIGFDFHIIYIYIYTFV